jgi:salicylate hydroxylase
MLEWGVDFDSIKKEVSRGNRFVDWKGKLLCDCPFDDVERRYGAPYYFIHRADLVNALREAAERNDLVTIRTGCKVVEYDFDTPAVKTENGTWFQGDLVIACDGIKSAVRDVINGRPCEPVDTGDVAYRILVPAAPLLEDPQMRQLVKEPWAVHWMGPEAHAVGYPLRGGELYNIIIDVTHRTDAGEPIGADDWKSARNSGELVARFKDWCEPVRKLCSLTGQYLKWRLADFDQLDHWVHPSGKVALLGDACHPMMPYMAQGAAQATEDAATLRAALKAYDNLKEALNAYEAQRKPRARYVAQNTRVLQEWLHLYDGPARDRRDELMKRDSAEDPIFWACSRRRDWLFGHNAEKLLNEDERTIPPLPPMPSQSASVYTNTDAMRLKMTQSRL